ncbi:MAG: hypothetical protein MUF48_08635 [Pirellulaceae bacterium]|jgi:hypothetical protein|nr:hypothetical protein [Pirellulaceae bacterium]
MTHQQTRVHGRIEEPRVADVDPAGAGPSLLQQQAAAYGEIARKALEECQQGLSADEALVRRRNRSGQ